MTAPNLDALVNAEMDELADQIVRLSPKAKLALIDSLLERPDSRHWHEVIDLLLHMTGVELRRSELRS